MLQVLLKGVRFGYKHLGQMNMCGRPLEGLVANDGLWWQIMRKIFTELLKCFRNFGQRIDATLILCQTLFFGPKSPVLTSTIEMLLHSKTFKFPLISCQETVFPVSTVMTKGLALALCRDLGRNSFRSPQPLNPWNRVCARRRSLSIR